MKSTIHRVQKLYLQRLLLTIFIFGCLTVQVSAQAVKTPAKLLFVGNSFTYRNGGIEQHMKWLASAANPTKKIESYKATQGGATLKILHELSWVHDSIRSGKFDIVILQEDIPELTEHSVEPFFTYAQLFNQEIIAAGSKAVLFMAWPYERLNWVTLDQIVEAHRSLGKKLHLPVAPVGIAFQNALKSRPGLAMLGPDKEHESIQGTYLAVCVLYATVFGENPEGLAYYPVGVSHEEANFLQRIAWETVQAWQKENSANE